MTTEKPSHVSQIFMKTQAKSILQTSITIFVNKICVNEKLFSRPGFTRVFMQIACDTRSLLSQGTSEGWVDITRRCDDVRAASRRWRCWCSPLTRGWEAHPRVIFDSLINMQSKFNNDKFWSFKTAWWKCSRDFEHVPKLLTHYFERSILWFTI